MGLFVWIGKNWLLVAAVLIAAGLLTDFIIYMIRWRPQGIWSAKFNRIFHRDFDELDEKQFDEGFNDSIPDFDFTDAPISGLDFSQAKNPDMMEAYYDSAPESPAYFQNPPLSPDGSDPAEESRHRRSLRHQPRIPLFPNKIRIPAASAKHAEVPLDSRAAFHDAVYPSSEIPPAPESDNEDQHHG